MAVDCQMDNAYVERRCLRGILLMGWLKPPDQGCVIAGWTTTYHIPGWGQLNNSFNSLETVYPRTQQGLAKGMEGRLHLGYTVLCIPAVLLFAIVMASADRSADRSMQKFDRDVARDETY